TWTAARALVTTSLMTCLQVTRREQRSDTHLLGSPLPRPPGRPPHAERDHRQQGCPPRRRRADPPDPAPGRAGDLVTLRIESGMRGPTLLLDDELDQRREWDDVEIKCHKDRDGTFRITVYRDGEKVLNHRLSGVAGTPSKEWSQRRARAARRTRSRTTRAK